MSPQSDNIDGFFEQLPIVRLNNKLLAASGATWDNVPSTLDFHTLSSRPIGSWTMEAAGDAAITAWNMAFGETSGDIVCKDPRLALTLPVWLTTAITQGFDPAVILVHRDPIAIASSLASRNGIPFAKSCEVITDYWLDMLLHAPERTQVVSYIPFADAPVKTLAGLGYNISKGEDEKNLRTFVRMPKAAPTLPNAVVPEPLRKIDRILRAAHGTYMTFDKTNLAAHLREREHRKAYAGNTYFLSTPPMVNFATANPKRTVVLHCHIFKNAGSSVDIMLKEYFGPRWLSHEFPVRTGLSNADLTNSYIRCNDNLGALSTHTGDWCLDLDGNGLNVLPILFLRHPVLRIRSAYSFERNQKADTVGADLAKKHDLRGYVRARLDRLNDFAFRDFQARRLAVFENRITTDVRTSALRALARIPFVGLVEEFDASARQLEAYIAPYFPQFKAYTARANVTDVSDTSIEQKIERTANELGNDLYEELVVANETDFCVYRTAVAKWHPDRSRSKML